MPRQAILVIILMMTIKKTQQTAEAEVDSLYPTKSASIFR
jgi:hypothetical protein